MSENLYQVTGSVVPDNLIAGVTENLNIKGITILTGQGALKRGTVLGVITKALGEVVADEGNTGNGTITAFALKAKSKVGNYKLICTAAAENAGTFNVYDPEGNRLADATVAVAYANDQIGFTINDGSADFIVGDNFVIPVEEGSKKAKIVNSANVDGSQVADCILTDDVDATSADVNVQAYTTGMFNRQALVFGGSDTAAKHEDVLRTKGIILKDNIAN